MTVLTLGTSTSSSAGRKVIGADSTQASAIASMLVGVVESIPKNGS